MVRPRNRYPVPVEVADTSGDPRETVRRLWELFTAGSSCADEKNERYPSPPLEFVGVIDEKLRVWFAFS